MQSFFGWFIAQSVNADDYFSHFAKKLNISYSSIISPKVKSNSIFLKHFNK
jgi:hypothetical protein